jgi:hypothetical protein
MNYSFFFTFLSFVTFVAFVTKLFGLWQNTFVCNKISFCVTIVNSVTFGSFYIYCEGCDEILLFVTFVTLLWHFITIVTFVTFVTLLWHFITIVTFMMFVTKVFCVWRNSFVCDICDSLKLCYVCDVFENGLWFVTFYNHCDVCDAL